MEHESVVVDEESVAVNAQLCGYKFVYFEKSMNKNECAICTLYAGVRFLSSAIVMSVPATPKRLAVLT